MADQYTTSSSLKFTGNAGQPVCPYCKTNTPYVSQPGQQVECPNPECARILGWDDFYEQ
jgi:hypothetical protein